MKIRFPFAAAVAAGLAIAPMAYAEDAMTKPGMAKDKMEKSDKMEKKDGMSKASDTMKKTDGMMDKKDNMSKDDMKK